MTGFKTSIVHYDKRGGWGSSKYPGNTTGYLVKDLCETYSPKTAIDPMDGSGTAPAVFKELGIEHKGYDITRGHDLLSSGTQRQIVIDCNMMNKDGIDLVFWHPPYWKMIRYDLEDPRDFSSGPYAQYLARMGRGMKFLSSLLDTSNPKARLAIQIGDYRKDGKYYWIARDLTETRMLARAELELDAIVIREQHGVTSDQTQYRGPLIRIMHEYLLILRPTWQGE